MAKQKRIVICGAGIVGASTAYFLSRRYSANDEDMDVLVVDGYGIASCASGKAGGFLADGWSDGAPLQPLARAGWKLHEQLMANFESSGKDVGYRRLRTYGVTVDASKVTDQSSSTTAGPINSDRSNPMPAKKDNSSEAEVNKWLRYVKGYHQMGTTHDTGQVHPGKLTIHLMALAQERGVKYQRGTVEGFKYLDDAAEVPKVSAVVVDGQEIPADIVVIAMGPWSGRASQWLPQRAAFPSGITGSVAYSITLRPSDPQLIPPEAIFLDYRDSEGTSDAEIYPRTDEVYLCIGHPDMEFPERPMDVKYSEAVSKRLYTIASTASSLLATAVQPDRRQTCFLPLSPDGRPLIGRVPAVEDVFVATGHSCWGILCGPITGQVISELIIDGSATSADISSYDPARFSRRRSS